MAEWQRVEAVRSAYQSFNGGDIEAVLSLLDVDVELRPAAAALEPHPIRGREAVREYLSPNLFDLQAAEPQEFIEERNRILPDTLTLRPPRFAGEGEARSNRVALADLILDTDDQVVEEHLAEGHRIAVEPLGRLKSARAQTSSSAWRASAASLGSLTRAKAARCSRRG